MLGLRAHACAQTKIKRGSIHGLEMLRDIVKQVNAI